MAQETESADERVELVESPPVGRSVSSGRRRRALAIALPVVALFALFLPAVLDARLTAAGRTRGGVLLFGKSARGMTRPELERQIGERGHELERERFGVTVARKRFEVDPGAVGVRVDAKASVRRVLEIGRAEGFFGSLAGYWKRRFSPVSPALAVSLDREKVERALAGFEAAALTDRPFSGGIALSGGAVRALSPHGGRMLDRKGSEAAIAAALASGAPRDVVLPVVSVGPPLPVAAAEEPARLARALLAGPITLRAVDPPATVTLASGELGPLLAAEPRDAGLRLVIDPAGLARALERYKGNIERDATNAKFVIDAKGVIGIEPSQNGIRFDLARLPAALEAAAARPDRSSELPLLAEPTPKLTTQAAQGLGIRGLVSSFTTRHPCCERRVENIHRIADLLDGTVVLPGQTVSVNELVGPRTEKNGFVPAPTIEEGEMVDSVGGGISQFATTFFNALFHGGYDIVERQPHSYWFPRYPMGHEATLSWPKPDIIFKNDTEAGMLIKTAYTQKSITVTIYGDNGGRKVTSSVSGRKEVVPAPLEILPNPKVSPDKERVKEPGSVGWSVIASRLVTFSDGTTKEERRKVTYKARPRRIEVHPCRIPEGEKGYTGEICPEPEGVTELPDAGSPG